MERFPRTTPGVNDVRNLDRLWTKMFLLCLVFQTQHFFLPAHTKTHTRTRYLFYQLPKPGPKARRCHTWTYVGLSSSLYLVAPSSPMLCFWPNNSLPHVLEPKRMPITPREPKTPKLTAQIRMRAKQHFVLRHCTQYPSDGLPTSQRKTGRCLLYGLQINQMKNECFFFTALGCVERTAIRCQGQIFRQQRHNMVLEKPAHHGR